MFWKFLVSVLLLPSCLGFEIAAASVKNEVQSLPKSEELRLPMQQTEANQDVVNSSLFWDREASLIPGVQQADSGELKHTIYQQPYLIAHRYYHRRCLQGNRYYLRGYYYPEYASYHRHYHHGNGYYRYRNHYPRHGYYHQRHYYNNGYYRHGDYHHNGYYRHHRYHY